MTKSLLNGYFINGLNNVKSRYFLQVLGIHKIHEHNLSNALRDFALLSKSDSANQLVYYKDDFIRFVHLMRPSEICMVAHGYSQIHLDDLNWWSKFNNISSEIIYDIDAQEIAGLVHSLTRIYTTQQPIICQLLEEYTKWTIHTTSSSLSMLVRAVANINMDPGYLRMFNKRAMELYDKLNILDVIFLLTSNSKAQIKDVDLYTKLCTRAIVLLDDMEYHHIRAVAASIGIGGFKSYLMFNILTIRLLKVLNNHTITEGDLISLLLSFTRQFFVTTELQIDQKLYTDVLLKYGYNIDKDKFTFPLKEIYPVFCNALDEKLDLIEAKGMPILVRAIYILKIPVEQKTMDKIFEYTATFIRENSYYLDKMLSLIYSSSRFREKNTSFWKATYEWFSQLDLNKISKVDLVKVLFLDCSKENTGYMNDTTLLYLLTHCFKNQEYTVIADARCIEALTANVDKIALTNLISILKSYRDFYIDHELPMLQFSRFLDSVQMKIQNSSNIACDEIAAIQPKSN
ncbi:hypothetical protein BEWA_020020 [Theileria equi strain WA]|uniref:RNA-editing substrate-binding complex 6 protein domain-containing protein n=1 Tax=Theileria equi strain WA TaxID=1537102 RepID=L0AVV1_THEEQ|nr:hypothetical protein BEWA_020020 [Theileria equi strain WA]AFZ79156.1 hypothetical protein BEWA_020020 [Theileria equi strain WA]|eukprot:XP_004828822.1 hypothetical protein BEWA_020020 [Theileria equi strain WA]